MARQLHWPLRYDRHGEHDGLFNVQPKFPRPKCSVADSNYPGYVDFTAKILKVPTIAPGSTLKRIFVFDSDGKPQANYSIPLNVTGSFADRVGGGETNIYQLGC